MLAFSHDWHQVMSMASLTHTSHICFENNFFSLLQTAALRCSSGTSQLDHQQPKSCADDSKDRKTDNVMM